MGRLFVLLFLLPWWAYIPASIGVLWLGERVYEQALDTEAEKTAALEAPMPAAVDLGSFDRDRDIHAAEEVHVAGWINADLNYELVKKKYGVNTSTRHMYMMFGLDDPVGAPKVRAALMLTPEEREKFIDHGEEFVTGRTDAGELAFVFNGFADTDNTMGSMASEAIKEQGLAESDDFIFVEPFFEGREAALAPYGAPDRSRYLGWLIAAGVALIGVVKRIMSVRARLSREELEAAAAPDPEDHVPEPVAATPAFSLPSGVSEDTPLGRLARKTAGLAAPSVQAEPVYAASGTAETDIGSHEPEAAEPEPEAEPQSVLVYDSAQPVGGETEDRFPPVPDDNAARSDPQGRSDAGFYAKLAFGMLVVGGLAYKPSLINSALPFAAVALFWLGVYVVFQKARNGTGRAAGSGVLARKVRRPPKGSAQTVSVGVGGHQIDLTAPVQSARRESGVI